MVKKHKIIMLSTEDKTNLFVDSKLFTTIGELEPQTGKSINSIVEGQHLYIISDEEIKEGDWITDTYRVWQWKDDCSLLGRKKLLASTDPKLTIDTSIVNRVDVLYDNKLPQIPQQFIESYCESPVEEVELEYEEKTLQKPYDVYSESVTYLKLVNNEVVINNPKEVFTREEVEEHLKRLANAIYPNPGGNYYKAKNLFMANWLKENL